jgi:hypothetical protein
VLALEAGRWTASEIISRIKATHARYRSPVRVESHAAQDYFRQFLETEGIPVEAHTTGRDRNDSAFGIESFAVELQPYNDPRNDDGSWVVHSQRPSLPLAWYERFETSWVPGASTGARALHSATSRPVAVPHVGRSSEAGAVRLCVPRGCSDERTVKMMWSLYAVLRESLGHLALDRRDPFAIVPCTVDGSGEVRSFFGDGAVRSHDRSEVQAHAGILRLRSPAARRVMPPRTTDSQAATSRCASR